jgi:hypothetical protein
MTFNEWVNRWNIPAEAVDEFRRDVCNYIPPPGDNTTEAGAVNAVRLEASRKGLRLWRNNIGAVTDERGNFIRYGLANDSAAVNRILKSSDLIGIRPVKLSNGTTIGQFVAREIKAPGWKYRGTDREKAQLNFLQFIAAMGGDAQFTTGEGSL